MWYQYSRGNKYYAKSTQYNGITYASKFEAGYAQELDIRLYAKEIKKWERQYKVSIDVNGFHICNYYVDFLIHHTNGDKELVEIKGFPTEVWRLKRKLLEAVWLPKHKNYRYSVIK